MNRTAARILFVTPELAPLAKAGGLGEVSRDLPRALAAAGLDVRILVPGYPDRILPVDEKAAAILKKRTLTNLYNERPAWLDHAHRDLDAAVAAAYGWPAGLTDEQILERLFKLNQARAA